MRTQRQTRHIVSPLVVAFLVVLGTLGQASAQVYVSNVDGDTVTVISPATNAVVTSITVGNEPRNLAATPAGDRVYVPNRFDDNVSVIDTATNTVITTVTDASFDEPYGVAVTPDGSEAWVINKQGGGSSTGSVTIINTATNAVSGTVNNVCFNSPEGIALNPVQARAYVVNRGNGTVCVVNTTTRAVIATVTVGGEPRYAVVTPDGTAVFVSRSSGNNVARINTADNTVTSIVISGTPRNMAITPSGNKVYVATQNGSVSVIQTSSNGVSTIPLSGASSTYGVAIAQAGTSLLAYVTDESAERVHVIDTATDTEVTGSGLPIDDPSFNTPRAIAAAVEAAAQSQPIPTLSEWAMILMGVLLAATAIASLGRRRPLPPAA